MFSKTNWKIFEILLYVSFKFQRQFVRFYSLGATDKFLPKPEKQKRITKKGRSLYFKKKNIHIKDKNIHKSEDQKSEGRRNKQYLLYLWKNYEIVHKFVANYVKPIYS